MIVRVGNQTAWSAPSPLAPFEFALRNGFDAFEWFPDKHGAEGWDVDDVAESQWEHVRDAAAGSGMRLSVHASLQADVLREDGVERLLADCRFASAIGAVLVNLHMDARAPIDALVDALERVLEHAGQAGLVLSVENTPLVGPEYAGDLFEALQARGYGPERIGMCLDLGHANLYAGTRNDYLAYLDRLGAHVPIVHAHVHENRGDADSHMTLFTGPSRDDDRGIRGFVERMRQRGFDGSMIMEQWPVPPSLLVEARRKLLQLVGDSLSSAVTPVAAAQGEGGFAATLAAADRARPSWLQKLQWVADVLEASGPADIDRLACVAVYLRYVGTGAVPCTESGGHQRPNHHAAIARRIRARLARITTPHNQLLVRLIQPWLPSSSAAFTRAEPLTRIRDIAHRSDIPRELKDRIKRTLQNKLHRNAGPEDLRTSEALLAEVLANRQRYPAAFVKELSVFHEELEEFFQARSLPKLLESFAATLPDSDQALVHAVLDALSAAHTRDGAVRALELVLLLRTGLAARWGAAAAQSDDEARVLDVRLEERSFLLLGQLANGFEADSGVFDWRHALPAVLLGVQSLALDGFRLAEGAAVQAELDAWIPVFDAGDRRHLLRLKATLDRARRWAGDYADMLLGLLPPRARAVGQALGVAASSIAMYTEGELRGHVVFQLSRVLETLGRRVRLEARLPPWDCIVPGRAEGRLDVVESLDDVGVRGEQPIVCVVRKLDPDGAVPLGVTAVLCLGDLAHLSHFAVRARQAHTVLASCADPQAIAALQSLSGLEVVVDAGIDAVVVNPVRHAHGALLDSRTAPRAAAEPVDLRVEREVIPLAEVTPAIGGAKAFAARRLRELLSGANTGVFSPDGLVVPYGVLRQALAADPAAGSLVRQLASELGESDELGQELRLRELRRVVMQLSVPPGVARVVARQFEPSERLMVRSSSNLEDLAGQSGAGLFDSVADVAPAECADAIKRVWASLWNTRAWRSRRQAGLADDAGQMAVLLQPMIVADYAFVLHTWHPVTRRRGQVYIEVAVGMGETLVRGDDPGAPYRMVSDLATGEVSVLSYASWSTARTPGGAGALNRIRVRYDRERLSARLGELEELGRQLGAVGRLVEDSFGAPQDIEGVIRGGRVTLVQARPQEGLT